MLSSDIETLIDPEALQRQDAEWRYIVDRVDWEQYETGLAKTGDNARYRVTYLDGALEIMSPSRRHENRKTRIGDLLVIYFLEADINYFPFGSTTLRQEEQRSGIEPDEAYCIGTDKDFPDLAIEVIVTSGGIDKLEVYRRLNVREVWFWENDQFHIYALQAEISQEVGKTSGYEPISRSEILPALDIELLAEYVRYPNSLMAGKEFRQRLRSGS
ncbi:MAG: Uma2 family endonuclease [Oscillatoriaceae cyanobacterium]